MSLHPAWNPVRFTVALGALAALAGPARADVVTDANERAVAIASTVTATPIAVRTMAIVQVSVHDVVQAIEGRHRPVVADFRVPARASVAAAVASATRTVLLALVPAKRTDIEADYQAMLAHVPAGAGREEGIAAGERSAAAVLAARAGDGADATPAYRPRTTPGVYVPTALPLLPQWGRRKPWLMATGEQFRPAPPSVDSDTWQRDLVEIAAVGGKNSARRTPAQTEVARFWETTSPSVYWPVVRCIAKAGAGSEAENARLLAEAAMAMDDALIAVFDAKYAYEFWRPVTAVRNAAGSAGDPGWEPLIATPMHPEYPCAHCIVSAAVGAVLESRIGGGASPTLRSTSPTGDGEHTWASPAEFVREVSEARICAGVHYRNSTEVAQVMGRRIGELAARRFPVMAR